MILQSVRWYLAYALRYRDIEEVMQERGFEVDHSTLHRGVMHYAPAIRESISPQKRKPNGQWIYYYRAVYRNGETVDFLLTAKRDKMAAIRYLQKAISANGKPSLINIDKSGANTVAIEQYYVDENKRITLRQCKCLNNIVKQDHRFITRIIKAMLGFKKFFTAK